MKKTWDDPKTNVVASIEQARLTPEAGSDGKAGGDPGSA